MARVAGDTGKRAIRFYGVDAGKGKGGVPIIFDAVEVMGRIQGMPFDGAVGSRYMALPDGSVIYTDVASSHGDGQVWFAIRHTNRENFPQIEKSGVVTHLEDAVAFDANAGLLDSVMAVFFPHAMGGFLGICFSGSRSYDGVLARYIVQRSGWSPSRKLRIYPLIHRDTLGKIRELEEVGKFEFDVREPFVSSLDESSNIWKVLDAMRSQPFRQRSYRCSFSFHEDDKPSVIEYVLSVVNLPGFVSNATKCLVRGRSKGAHRAGTINVLRDTLTYPVDLPKSRARGMAVDETLAYRTIVDLYQRHLEDIEAAFQLEGGTWPWGGLSSSGETDSLEQMLQEYLF